MPQRDKYASTSMHKKSEEHTSVYRGGGSVNTFFLSWEVSQTTQIASQIFEKG